MNVEPRLRDIGECQCADACGAYGTLKAPWRDGTRCVARKCRCKRCLGRNSNRGGHKKQHAGARKLGLVTGKFAPSNEEDLGGPLRFEHKSGANDAGPVRTRYEACRAQADAAKSIGDPRPFVAGFTPPDSRRMYVVVRDDDLQVVVFALAAAWGFAGEAS